MSTTSLAGGRLKQCFCGAVSRPVNQRRCCSCYWYRLQMTTLCHRILNVPRCNSVTQRGTEADMVQRSTGLIHSDETVKIASSQPPFKRHRSHRELQCKTFYDTEHYFTLCLLASAHRKTPCLLADDQFLSAVLQNYLTVGASL